MKKIAVLVIAVLLLFAAYRLMTHSRTVPKEKAARIERFLKTVIADSLEEDYRRHGMTMRAVVTKLTIERIEKEETLEFISYNAFGTVSYIIKGKRQWRDQQGNRVRLDPETEITHWFSCGVLEDRHGDLLKDTKNRLVFFADNPLR